MTESTGELIKTSKNPIVQQGVEQRRTRIFEKEPERTLSSANNQARREESQEIRIQRLRGESKKSLKDKLTGLLSKEGFDAELSKAIELTLRSHQPTILFFFDANNLKHINDEHGHAAGDAYLRKIGEVLGTGTRETDVTASIRGMGAEETNGRAARWGGDEFGVILTFTNKDGAMNWWKRINSRFAERNISIAAGASIIEPKNIPRTKEKRTEFIDQVKREADDALYVAKPDSKKGNGNIMYFYDDLTAEQLSMRDNSHPH